MPTVSILVPLQPPHNCQLCLPIPREYIDHAGLVRHLKREHDTTLHFECRACGLVLDKLKSLKAHQRRAEACRTCIEANSPPPPPPANRRIMRIPLRPRKAKNRAPPHQNAAPPGRQSSCSSSSPSPQPGPAPSRRRRVIRPVDTSLLDSPPQADSQAASPMPAPAFVSPWRPNRLPSFNCQSPQHSPSTSALNVASHHSPIGDLPHSSPGAVTSDFAEPTSGNSACGHCIGPSTPPTTCRPTPTPASGRPRRRHSASSQVSFQTDPPLHGSVEVNHHLVTDSAADLQLQRGPTDDQLQFPAGTPSHQISETTFQPPASDSSTTPSWVLNWKNRFEAAIDGDMLESMVNDLVALAQDICSISDTTIQPAAQPSSQSPATTDARNIQRLYRRNKKKAIGLITNGQPNYCRISRQVLQSHFTRLYDYNPHHHPSAPPVDAPEPCLESNNPLAAPFTPAEVASRLRRCHNTAPGPDGLRYHHWMRVDPNGTILSSVFNAALRTSSTPPCWQNSNTVLIHKKGSTSNIGNWRPIALSNTLGKVFSACLANRLLNWCNVNSILSNAQKGFLQHEGCLDHSFLLQSIIQDARRKRRSCHIAWLDISNAFGSVPHETIVQCLQWCGLHDESIDIVNNLLRDCTTKIRAHDGYTNEIPIKSGVKQGCPLSPLLFNIVIETAIRRVHNLQLGYSLEGEEIGILAYADDLVLVSPSPEGLQKQLDNISHWADWAGLCFKPSKCATLSVLGSQHSTGDDTFTLCDAPIPLLRSNESYSYLGVPTGFSTHHTSEDIITNLERDLQLLDDSNLAPWQKLNAVNTMFLPRLTYHLLLGSNPKKRLHALDRRIKTYAKRWLNLPQRASAEVVHLPYDHGGANITPCSTLSDICQITHGVHLFTSRDSRVSSIAINSLRSVVRKRIRRTPSLDDLCTYLNGSMEGEFGMDPADITSTWTRLRMATRRLRKTMDIAWIIFNDSITISAAGNPIPRHTTSKALTSMAKNHLLNRLLRKPDQGKAIKLTAQHPASNHFLRDGLYTSFADWRFIHRARLSVVPLNGLRRFGQLSPRCRRCGYQQETLAHVLNHCGRNLHLATERHNAVLNRLRRAINDRDITVRCNQQVPGYDDNCRPDSCHQRHRQDRHYRRRCDPL
ncbi:uncharacterized protein LOC111617982 [Centruroides sculpturatus]|uniref:uncharacterized protein LOC111617982 n=1 Tax=Centruroides sculpturatus TaxID=218467 RepID=UPI000C6D4EDA|nr:uncharacterized protein LOC111617982 [Centruroides sculpturatus]